MFRVNLVSRFPKPHQNLKRKLEYLNYNKSYKGLNKILSFFQKKKTLKIQILRTLITFVLVKIIKFSFQILLSLTVLFRNVEDNFKRVRNYQNGVDFSKIYPKS